MPDGFFSVLEHAGGPYEGGGRARVRDDLVALRRWVPRLGRIYAGKGTDYPFRCFVSKAEFAQGLMAAVTEGLTYANYKSAVHESDPKRAAVLSQAWSVFRQLEDAAAAR